MGRLLIWMVLGGSLSYSEKFRRGGEFMSILLSKYLELNDELKDIGAFDPILNEDSRFFVNLQRLKITEVSEFLGSYDKIKAFFRGIIKLLDKAREKNDSDTYYRQALRRFDFPEVNGTCLGYSKSSVDKNGTLGTGLSGKLAKRIINTAYDIVKAGINDPEFFELIPLFQENVGADRLSDMISRIIIDDIENYTLRVNKEIGINKKQYTDMSFIDGFLINPYSQDKILLVPVDILHKLPVVETWEDVGYAVSANNYLRAEMNQEVAEEWKTYSSGKKKSYLLNNIFMKPNVFERVIAGYREEEIGEFDPDEDTDYFIAKLWQSIKLDYIINHKVDNSYEAAIDIINFFKHWVEELKGWDVILDSDTRKREKIVQKIFHGMALAYIIANRLDISAEPNEGHGPVDFKISKGDDKTITEIKLSSNNQYLHGYEKQIEKYGRAEMTDKLIYVYIDLGSPIRLRKLMELYNKCKENSEKTPNLIVIDSTEKKSASLV